MTTPNETLDPAVCRAVRAVGLLKPKFNPGQSGRVFAESLEVKGTAFWVKPQKVLVTCAHVVRDIVGAPIEITGLLVVGNRGHYTRARIGIMDFDHDIAILHPDFPPDILVKEAESGLDIADTYPPVGTPVAYAGFPLGTQLLDAQHAPTYSEGVIGAQLRLKGSRKNLQITGAVVGGFSGSPVIDKNNGSKVLGVLSHSPSKEAGDANIFMISSWEHLKALADLCKS